MERRGSDRIIKDWIWAIRTHIDAIDNENRRRILELCYKEPKTISELTRLLKSSNKVTWNNVMQLERIGLVGLDKRKHEKHQPVYVESRMLPEEIAKDFIGWFSKELSKEVKKKTAR